MTADDKRPPILLIRAEGILGGAVELHLLDPDGGTRLIERRESLGPGENLETLLHAPAMDDVRFQDVIVDLERVSWLNSTGLGWLVGLFRQRKQDGDMVAIIGVNERIANLLQVTSLDLTLPAHDSLAAAAGSLRAGGTATAD